MPCGRVNEEQGEHMGGEREREREKHNGYWAGAAASFVRQKAGNTKYYNSSCTHCVPLCATVCAFMYASLCACVPSYMPLCVCVCVFK